MLSLATLSSLHPCLHSFQSLAIYILASKFFFVSHASYTLQASPSLQARWWEDVDFLQFTETFCQGGNHVKASKWSVCTYMHYLVHQRVNLFYISASTLCVCSPACTKMCVSILRFCINFERVLTCASTSFSTHTSLLKDRAWETFLKIMMHRVSFASQRMKRSFPVRKKYKYCACPPINAAHLESKLKRDNFSNQPTSNRTEPFKSARIFTPLMRLEGKFSSYVL